MTPQGIDSSLFAVFRIVTIMLWRDGRVARVERKWFTWLMSRYELSREQRQILFRDLEKAPLLKEVYPFVANPRDRERLLSWLRIAMKVDGECRPEELQFYTAILAEERKIKTLDDHYRELADSLRQHEADVRFWQDMARFGKLLGRRYPWFGLWWW